MKEKDAPYALAVEVLRRLSDAGILGRMILVGSWCVYFYKDYFRSRDDGTGGLVTGQ